MSTTYYINGTNFSTATAVYTDAELTTCAPDGYYRLGGITRQQLNCQLLQEEECNDCGVVDCGNETSYGPVQGSPGFSNRYFITEYDLSSAVSKGAVVVVIKLIIPFKPTAGTTEIPSAIQVVHNGTNYSEVIRKVGDTTIIGSADVNSVGLAYPNPPVETDFIVVGGYNEFPNGSSYYDFYRYNGSDYETDDNRTNISIENNNKAQEATSSPIGPDYVVLVIPKNNANANQLIVDILQKSVITHPTLPDKIMGFGFKMYVHCPTLLTPTADLYGDGGPTGTNTATEACASTDVTTLPFYAVGSGTGLNTDTSLVTLNPTLPQLRDVLFLDDKGNQRLTPPFDGWYRVDTEDPATDYAIEVEDGIVSDIYSCSS